MKTINFMNSFLCNLDFSLILHKRVILHFFFLLKTQTEILLLKNANNFVNIIITFFFKIK